MGSGGVYDILQHERQPIFGRGGILLEDTFCRVGLKRNRDTTEFYSDMLFESTFVSRAPMAKLWV